MIMRELITIGTLFVIGSCFGYILEVLFRRFVSQKHWVNPGFMVGPYIPLYGFGTIILYGLSNIKLDFLHLPFAWEVVVRILIIAILVTLVELIAGLIFIRRMHIKLWDYSDRWGNFKGVICPLFSFLWLLCGSAYYFFANGTLVHAISWINNNLIYTFFIGVVIGMMIVDAAYSLHLGIQIKKASDGLTIKFDEIRELVNSNENIKHVRATLSKLSPDALRTRIKQLFVRHQNKEKDDVKE